MAEQPIGEESLQERSSPPAQPRAARWSRLLLSAFLIGVALLFAGAALRMTRAARLTDHAMLLNESDPAQARISVEKALAIWPTYPDALVFMAQLEHELKEDEKASKFLRVAVDVAPAPGDSMWLLGSLLASDPAKVEEGLKWFQLGMRIAPPEGQQAALAWSSLAEAASKVRRHDLVIWAMLHAENLGYTGEAGKKILADAYRAIGLKEMAIIAEAK